MAAITVDDLERILADPFGGSAALEPEQARALATQFSQAAVALMHRALDGKDRLISPDAAAKLLDCSARYIRDNAKSLPFTEKLGDEWKCSENAVQRFIADRRRK